MACRANFRCSKYAAVVQHYDHRERIRGRETHMMAKLPNSGIFRPSLSRIQKITNWASPSLSLTNSSLQRNRNASLLARASSATSPSIRPDLSLSIGVHQIPHPKKVERGGEDAFFISSYNGGAIGIADGVSGWAEKNVDPALFSREFMANASSFIDDEEVKNDPQMLLMKAHASSTCIGSATVIIAMLEGSGMLKIANVGDCGARIVRKGRIIFSTSPVEHYFDCPYQLSSEVTTQTFLDAVVCNVKLLEGDIIVMGSDGLFDNVFDHEIVSTVASHSNVIEMAKVMAILANDHSKDTNFESPYSIEARSRGIDVPSWKKVLGMRLTGGKLDDITVVVARVVRSKEDSFDTSD